MARLTDRSLRRKWTGKDEWLSDGGSRGAGRLVAKLSSGCVTFYFQYYIGDRRRFLLIGPYDSKSEDGKTLLQARDQAHEWSLLLRTGVSDLHDFQADKERERLRLKDEAVAQTARESREAERSSLKQLLDAYCGHLARSGKQAEADVRRIFRLHVFESEPSLINQKASSISVDDFVVLLAKLTEAGKGRTAGKLRSYLRAAYSLAVRSKTDPDAPMSMRTFGITSNPIASISALSRYNRVRSRVLSSDELEFFIKRLKAMSETPKSDLLLLCLLLGGQRPTQLLRARLVDLDLGAMTITIFDPKGARNQPRVHILPLTEEAARILTRLAERSSSFVSGHDGQSSLLFTSDGIRGLRVETVSALVKDIATEMLEAKELRESFQLRDLRRTCETMMAAMGMSSDIRAQVQSHGLGGVQARHYDRHNYMEEKRTTLEKWNQHLDKLITGKFGAVIPMFQYR